MRLVFEFYLNLYINTMEINIKKISAIKEHPSLRVTEIQPAVRCIVTALPLQYRTNFET